MIEEKLAKIDMKINIQKIKTNIKKTHEIHKSGWKIEQVEHFNKRKNGKSWKNIL